MLVLASSGNAMAGTNNPTKIVIKEKKFAKKYSDEALLDLAEDGIVVKEAHVKVKPLGKKVKRGGGYVVVESDTIIVEDVAEREMSDGSVDTETREAACTQVYIVGTEEEVGNKSDKEIIAEVTPGLPRQYAAVSKGSIRSNSDAKIVLDAWYLTTKMGGQTMYQITKTTNQDNRNCDPL